MSQKQKEIIGILIIIVVAGIADYFLLKNNNISNSPDPTIQVGKNIQPRTPVNTNEKTSEETISLTSNLTSEVIIKDLNALFTKLGYINDDITSNDLWWIDNDVALNVRTKNTFTFEGEKSDGESYNLDTFKNDKNITMALKMVDDYMLAHEFTKQDMQSIDAHPEWNHEFNYFMDYTEGFYNSEFKVRCRFDLGHLYIGRDEEEPPYKFSATASCINDKEYKDVFSKQAPLLRALSGEDKVGYPIVLNNDYGIQTCKCKNNLEIIAVEEMNAGSHDSFFFGLKKVDGMWVNAKMYGYDIDQCSCAADDSES